MIDCEKQGEAKNNYNNKLRQKLAKQALYRKNGAALFIVLYGQLHSDIVTIAKNWIIPLFATVHKERDIAGLLSILCSICVQNLTGYKVDPYLEQLKILSFTFSYVQTKGISNHNFGDTVHDQVFATQSQCGAFAFGDNSHAKVLSNNDFSDLKDYFSFDQAKKDKYDTLARELVCSRLKIINSLSSKTHIYFKEQYVVNQSNYANTVVKAVAMINSFGNECEDRDRGNKNTNTIPEAIVPDNDVSVVSFESIANNRVTTNNDDLPGAEAFAADSKFENDNSNGNVETGDDDDGNNDDNNKATIMSGNNNEENSEGEDSVSNNNNTDYTTNPTDGDPVRMSLLTVADDYDEDDPGDYNEFCPNYDLDDDGVFDNDDTNNGEGYVCMTVTDSWFSLGEEEDEDDDILLRPGVFDVNGILSIHPNFFNGTLNDSLGCPYINDNPISNTQVLRHVLIKSLMRKKKGDVDNSIEHYDTLWCKFQRIGIHSSTNYFQLDSSESLQLILSNSGLPMIYQSTIDFINLELTFA